MAIKLNRDSLKQNFQKGTIPSENDFAELIDSVPNIEEDGLFRIIKEGIALFSKYQGGALLEMYDNEPIQKDDEPCWSFSIGRNKELNLLNENGHCILSVLQDKTVVFANDIHVYGKTKSNIFEGDIHTNKINALSPDDKINVCDPIEVKEEIIATKFRGNIETDKITAISRKNSILIPSELEITQNVKGLNFIGNIITKNISSTSLNNEITVSDHLIVTENLSAKQINGDNIEAKFQMAASSIFADNANITKDIKAKNFNGDIYTKFIQSNDDSHIILSSAIKTTHEINAPIVKAKEINTQHITSSDNPTAIAHKLKISSDLEIDGDILANTLNGEIETERISLPLNSSSNEIIIPSELKITKNISASTFTGDLITNNISMYTTTGSEKITVSNNIELKEDTFISNLITNSISTQTYKYKADDKHYYLPIEFETGDTAKGQAYHVFLLCDGKTTSFTIYYTPNKEPQFYLSSIPTWIQFILPFLKSNIKCGCEIIDSKYKIWIHSRNIKDDQKYIYCQITNILQLT